MISILLLISIKFRINQILIKQLIMVTSDFLLWQVSTTQQVVVGNKLSTSNSKAGEAAYQVRAGGFN